MSETQRKLEAWNSYRGVIQSEKDRIALLNIPMPRQDKKLFEPVTVLCKKGFALGGGKFASPGETVKLPRHVAESLVAQGRAELTNGC